MYSYSSAKKESYVVEGQGHSNNVSGLAASPTDGKIYSVGFDDHVREIDTDGSSYLCVLHGPA